MRSDFSVLTLTLNPCIDRSVAVAGVEYGGTNRVRSVRVDTCGKGVNVSIALRHLGVDTLCLGFNYAENGRMLEKTLEEQGIPYDFVQVPGSIRMNIKIFDESSRVMTEFNERGGRVEAASVEQLLEKISGRLSGGDLLVLSGSVPEGVPEDIYRTILCMAGKKGVRVVLDAAGGLLREGLKEKPYLIKPNRDEFEEAFGEKLACGKSMVEISREVIAGGVRYVCISLGSEGTMLVSANHALMADPLDIEVKGVQGAGDSLVAGMCLAIREGLSDEAMLRYAAAAAGASLLREGTQMCTLEDFRELLGRVRIREC